MATITPIKPHTRIDNDIIDDYLPKIGPYGYTIYSVIKRHFNQKTHQCNPSYATVARKSGIDRGTVIRYVKKLKALDLICPNLRFKEDGSPASNQYAFTPSENTTAPLPEDKEYKESGTEPPPLVAQNNRGGRTEPPEQSSSSNKKQRTITEVDLSADRQDLLPTQRQKTCPHPPTEIVILPDNITICNHCYGLLDENLKLVEEETPTEEIVAA